MHKNATPDPGAVVPDIEHGADRDTRFIRALTAILGEQWVATDPCLLDTYAWQMNAETVVEGRFLPRFMAVVLPADTREVAAVVRLCNRHGVKYKATATGQGPWNGPAAENSAIQIDLRRLNRILDIDARNMIAVVEPYVTNNQLQTECMKRGLTCHIVGAGGQASQLASATSFNGHGPDGISCGFSSRNLLGFEWVTPEGKIVRVGSFDASGQWFSGDGPGPSLRGVIRGFAGAMGGLGVFTRAAVKIYPWSGPPKLRIEGRSPNYYTHIPSTHFAGIVSLPDFRSEADFGYALGEAEIASHVLINAPYLSIAALYPDNNKAAGGYRIPLFNRMHRNIYLICTAAHEKEARWKQKVLHRLVSAAGGGFLGSDGGLHGIANKMRWAACMTRYLGARDMLRSLPGLAAFALAEFRVHGFDKIRYGSPLNNALYGRLVRADANVRTITSFGGSFVTSMGCIAPWDVTIRSAQATLAIRKRMIARGQLADDGGDGDHGGMYEGGAFTHIESVICYAPEDGGQAEFTRRYNAEMNHAAARLKMGVPITSFGPAGAHLFSPLAFHYDRFTQRIKSVFDPNNAAEANWYTDPLYQPPPEQRSLARQVEDDACRIDTGSFEKSAAITPIGGERDWLSRRGYDSIPV
jgi:hypothetical protein